MVSLRSTTGYRLASLQLAEAGSTGVLSGRVMARRFSPTVRRVIDPGGITSGIRMAGAGGRLVRGRFFGNGRQNVCLHSGRSPVRRGGERRGGGMPCPVWSRHSCLLPIPREAWPRPGSGDDRVGSRRSCWWLGHGPAVGNGRQECLPSLRAAPKKSGATGLPSRRWLVVG